jgi:type III pantothenate kinase
MLLALDIGNTNIVLGIFQKKKLARSWRLKTDIGRTSDEYGILLLELLHSARIAKEKITGIVIGSVVPPLKPVFENVVHTYFNKKAFFVEPGIKTGMPIHYDNPQDVGADRIINSVAAMEKYGVPVIIVDFGTATTFDVVSEKGEYTGGLIAPGICISADALFTRTAKLPQVAIAKPPRIIGKNTIGSIQAGIFYGYLGLVEGIVKRIISELGIKKVRVVATGGLSGLIASESILIDAVDADLTLEGLRILYEKNLQDAP